MGRLLMKDTAKVSSSVLGRDVTAVGLFWNDKGENRYTHVVGVEKNEGGYVYIDNPWGEAPSTALPSGVERYGEGGQIRMKEAPHAILAHRREPAL